MHKVKLALLDEMKCLEPPLDVVVLLSDNAVEGPGCS